jgi:capsular polysaccharide biosynthesis protein
MDLRSFFRIIPKRWWIAVLALIITTVLTALFAYSQPLVYEATSSFVLKPRTELITAEEDIVRAIDTISNRLEINTTFAEVASSKLIFDNAISALDLTKNEASNLSIESQVLPGTNVLEIIARGGSPDLVQNLANAVGQETLNYVRNLYDVFELQALEEAVIPSQPSEPNRPLLMIIGVIFGLLLGISSIFLSGLVQPEKEDVKYFDIIDHESGAFNRPYFLMRLREEMARAQKYRYPLAISLIKIKFSIFEVSSDPSWTIFDAFENEFSSKIRLEALRITAVLIQQYLRDEDVLAHYDDVVYAIMFPNMTGDSAQEFVEELCTKIASINQGVLKSRGVNGTAGVTASLDDEITIDEFLANASFALVSAENDSLEKVYYYS